ncbi:hypothetical protein [Rhodococcus rhodochrous]|uniref:hypothetical protein n=1 Tax=Rhodococcus rhodochrous TaxID=1829 RepID=UPI00188B6CC8|nr:hypothetical protein [Rhodococcus rhodochrous]MBF4478271.1 hypothetical protein [Rhodococcus rhodochrous]
MEITLTQYGYRLFAVELHHGRKQAAHLFEEAKLPLIDEAGVKSQGERVIDYRKVMVSEVTAAHKRTHTLGGSAESDDGSSPIEARGTAMRFLEASQVGDAIRMKFEFGARNADGTLIYDDSKEPDVELRGKPTLYPFRATLVTKPGLTRALLAVEARGRTCPLDAVVRGLHAVSADEWRLRILSHLAGEAAMMDYLRRAKIGKVVFDRWSFADDGSRTQNDVTLSVRSVLAGKSVRERVLEWGKDYFGFVDEYIEDDKSVDSDSSGTVQPAQKERLSREKRAALRKQQAAERKAAEAAEKAARKQQRNLYSASAANQLKQDIFSARVEDIEVEFNDVGVEMDDGQTKRIIKPTTDFKRFTYFLGHGNVSDDHFYSAAEASALGMIDGIQKLKLEQ